MKVLFIGMGSIGTRHIKNLVLVAGDREKLQIDVFRETRHPLDTGIRNCIANEYYQIEEIIPEYDAIFITNPTSLHIETLKRFKDFGHSFFIEKPITDDSTKVDPDLMNALSEKTVYVACPLRYSKVLQRAKKCAENQEIYAARSISSSYLPDWRPNIDYRQCYSAHKNLGGGVKIDLIHEWDYLTDMFGFPQKCWIVEGHYSKLEINCEDVALYIAQYPKMLAEIHIDYFGRYPQRYLELFDETVTWRFDILNNQILQNGVVTETFPEAPNDKYIAEMEFFYQLIQGKVRNTNDIQKALQVLALAQGLF